MQRVVIIDDEALARKGLKRLLSTHPGFRVVGEADGKESALELIRNEKPDAIFLDVQMPGATGVELLEELHPAPKVVMVTAHAEHAMHAFDVQAVDYLLKPVSPERFAQALRRIEAADAVPGSAAPKPSYATEDRICLRTPQRTVVAPIGSITALQADGDFTRIFFKDAPPLMICHPIREYEGTLPFPPFLRIDRSHIVNLDLMIRLERRSRDEGVLILEGVPEGIPVARVALARLREHIT